MAHVETKNIVRSVALIWSGVQLQVIIRTELYHMGAHFGHSKRMHMKLSSDEVVCCIYLLTVVKTLSVYINYVDSDQTAPSGSTQLDQKASKTFQQTSAADQLYGDWHFKG